MPQDQTTKTETPTPQVNNSKSSDFSPPSGWGKINTDTIPKTVIPEYPEVDSQSQTEKKESGLVKFVKIFLIAVALILLGVLLGVLTSNFLSSPKPTSNTQIPVSATPTASPSSQLESTPSVEPEYSKKIEYRNIGSGPFSFDLLLSDDWKIATKSTEKNNINIALNNQNVFVKLFYNPTVKTQKSEVCLLMEELAPKNIPYVRYDHYKDFQISDLSWRLIKNSQATESANYLICEQNKNNQFVSLTSVGFISTGKNSGEEINPAEENKVVDLFKGLKIINSTTSSALKR